MMLRTLLPALVLVVVPFTLVPSTTMAAEPPPASAAQAQIEESPQLVLPFTDVPSDHWAYQALLNLTGNYGCLSGYPDGTFRGEAAVTRYEFAAGMDACIGVLTGLIEQRQSEEQQAVEALIESMQQSLDELRQIDGESPGSL